MYDEIRWRSVGPLGAAQRNNFPVDPLLEVVQDIMIKAVSFGYDAFVLGGGLHAINQACQKSIHMVWWIAIIYTLRLWNVQG